MWTQDDIQRIEELVAKQGEFQRTFITRWMWGKKWLCKADDFDADGILRYYASTGYWSGYENGPPTPPPPMDCVRRPVAIPAEECYNNVSAIS